MRLSKIASAVLDPYIQNGDIGFVELANGRIGLMVKDWKTLNEFIIQCKKEKVKRKEKEKDKK